MKKMIVAVLLLSTAANADPTRARKAYCMGKFQSAVSEFMQGCLEEQERRGMRKDKQMCVKLATATMGDDMQACFDGEG